ncbi:hypothetical protein [Primorskyibacter flagellatus]|uniref:hypothetical protein n=1 Tax=Primorskyibacter flagellatus TaxID=1387277 RepID=UPI000A0743D4|nr:hypothetical protein [Primorskyibacter flagellatus]
MDNPSGRCWRYRALLLQSRAIGYLRALKKTGGVARPCQLSAKRSSRLYRIGGPDNAQRRDEDSPWRKPSDQLLAGHTCALQAWSKQQTSPM